MLLFQIGAEVRHLVTTAEAVLAPISARISVRAV